MAGSVWFGWDLGNFQIRKDGIAWARTLHEFPLSEEGWASAWQTIASQYPQLAATVSLKAAKERQIAREQDPLVQPTQKTSENWTDWVPTPNFLASLCPGAMDGTNQHLSQEPRAH